MKVKEKLYFACLSTAGGLINIKHAGLNIGDEVTTVNELDKVVQTGAMSFIVVSRDERMAFDMLYEHVKDKLYLFSRGDS